MHVRTFDAGWRSGPSMRGARNASQPEASERLEARRRADNDEISWPMARCARDSDDGMHPSHWTWTTPLTAPLRALHIATQVIREHTDDFLGQAQAQELAIAVGSSRKPVAKTWSKASAYIPMASYHVHAWTDCLDLSESSVPPATTVRRISAPLVWNFSPAPRRHWARRRVRALPRHGREGQPRCGRHPPQAHLQWRRPRCGCNPHPRRSTGLRNAGNALRPWRCA